MLYLIPLYPIPLYLIPISSFYQFPPTQGLASPRLNWDGRDGLGHGVPVPGADGYEYVR